VTPECASAWRNYECKVNDTGYERRTQDAFEAGWQAGWAQRGIADKTTVQVTIKPPPEMIDGPAIDFSTPTPSVGHVCVGPQSSRKPGLCWICGQALPHDCAGSAQPIEGSVATHGPPQNVDTIAAELIEQKKVLAAAPSSEPANRLAPPIAHTGRKWPIGTQDGQLARVGNLQAEWGARLAHARHRVNLTLDALGAKLNPPRTRKDISAMEHGRRGLSVELCAQLADALDCDRLWLAGWTL